VNEEGKKEGFGRRCYADGKIKEGFFVNDKLDKYGRVIFTDNSYYDGKY